jgi:TetR/AcrR family tetracycline transcriptional repressor
MRSVIASHPTRATFPHTLKTLPSTPADMRKRSARGTISRESVTDAALAIADRDGFDAVTMRAIATEVGATPMALYAYFSDKNALYAGMRERIFFVHVGAASIPRETWQSMLEGIARGLYGVMHAHPNWAPAIAHQSGPASSGLGFIDESLGLMLKDGFGAHAALNAYWCAMSFAVGSALCEHIIMGVDDGSAKFLARLKELPVRAPGRYTNLASAAARLDDWQWDGAFEFGIRSLLTGIEAQRAQPGESQPDRRPRAPGASSGRRTSRR